MNRFLIIAGFLLFVSYSSLAQINRYMVFFTDKGGDENPYSIERPEEFLSQRAIDRREKHGITISEQDLPVHPVYLDSLAGLDYDTYFATKWMNAVLIQGSPTSLDALLALDFVDSVALVAEKLKLTREQTTVELPESFDEPNSSTVTNDFQLAILQGDVMHNEGINGSGVIIAVLDNGFKSVNEATPFAHIWEEDRMLGYKNFVTNEGSVFENGSHGTSVFSTIAAKHERFAGMAYGASFVLCVTEEDGSEDRIEEFNWLFGAEYADSLGADVINASVGYRLFDIPEHNYDYEDLDGNTTIVSQAASIASEKGMVVAVSAGNQGDNPPSKWRYITPPADVESVLTVGSVNPDFSWTPFSSLGPTVDGRVKPDVSTLGLGTTIMNGNGNITRGNGTSFSSPQIAGLAAGIIQSRPEWTSSEVIEAIKNSGHRSFNPDTLVGFGVPTFNYALNGRVLQVEDILEERIQIYPNPIRGNKLHVRVTDGFSKKLELQLIDSEGKSYLNESVKLRGKQKTLSFDLPDLTEGIYFLSLQYQTETRIVKLLHFE